MNHFQTNRQVSPTRTATVQSLPRAQVGARFLRDGLLVGALLLVVRLTLLQRQRQDFASVDSSAKLQIVIVGLMGILLAINPGKLPILWRRLASTSGRLFLGFYALCIVSAFWSSMPAYSAFRAVEFLIQVLALFTFMAFAEDFLTTEKFLIIMGLAVTGMEIIGLVVHYGVSLQSVHSNSYSASAAMVFCYSLGESLGAQGKRRLQLRGVAGVSFLLVLLGQSFASWLAILFGTFLALMTTKRLRLFAFVLAGVFLVLVLTLPGAKRIIFMPSGAEDKVENLNGRRTLWESYYALAREKPFLGYGYAVSARTQGAFYATNTHNIVFATMLGTGLAGMLIVSLALLRGGIETIRSQVRGKMGSVGCFCALAGGLINGLSISLICESWMPPSFVFVLFYGFHLFQVVKAPRLRGRPIPQPVIKRPRGYRFALSPSRTPSRAQFSPTHLPGNALS